jgi:hypothetical protein
LPAVAVRQAGDRRGRPRPRRPAYRGDRGTGELAERVIARGADQVIRLAAVAEIAEVRGPTPRRCRRPPGGPREPLHRGDRGPRRVADCAEVVLAAALIARVIAAWLGPGARTRDCHRRSGPRSPSRWSGGRAGRRSTAAGGRQRRCRPARSPCGRPTGYG